MESTRFAASAVTPQISHRERTVHRLTGKDYFKYYRAVTVVDTSGRERKALRYYGDYYCNLLYGKQLVAGKASLMLETLLTIAVYVFLATRNVPLNREGFASAFCVLMVFPLFFVTIGTLAYLISPEKLNINQYRSSIRFVGLGAVSLVAVSGLSGAIALVTWLIHFPTAAPEGYIVVILCYGVIAGIATAIRKTINSIPFRIEKGILSDDDEKEQINNV